MVFKSATAFWGGGGGAKYHLGNFENNFIAFIFLFWLYRCRKIAITSLLIYFNFQLGNWPMFKQSLEDVTSKLYFRRSFHVIVLTEF